MAGNDRRKHRRTGFVDSVSVLVSVENERSAFLDLSTPVPSIWGRARLQIKRRTECCRRVELELSRSSARSLTALQPLKAPHTWAETNFQPSLACGNPVMASFLGKRRPAVENLCRSIKEDHGSLTE